MAVEQQLARKCDIAHEDGFRVLFLATLRLPGNDASGQRVLERTPRNRAIPPAAREQPCWDAHRKLQQRLGKQRRDELWIGVSAKRVVILGWEEQLPDMEDFSVRRATRRTQPWVHEIGIPAYVVDDFGTHHRLAL